MEDPLLQLVNGVRYLHVLILAEDGVVVVVVVIPSIRLVLHIINHVVEMLRIIIPEVVLLPVLIPVEDGLDVADLLIQRVIHVMLIILLVVE